MKNNVYAVCEVLGAIWFLSCIVIAAVGICGGIGPYGRLGRVYLTGVVLFVVTGVIAFVFGR